MENEVVKTCEHALNVAHGVLHILDHTMHCLEEVACKNPMEGCLEPKKVQERPQIGVGVIIRRANRVLMSKRLCEHAKGTWSFPGGHLEMWESLSECAIREVKEEVGEDIKITSPTFWNYANTPFKNENKHYIVMFMVCDYISGTPKRTEPDKNTDWEWFKWDNLPAPLMMGTQYLVDKGYNPL